MERTILTWNGKKTFPLGNQCDRGNKIYQLSYNYFKNQGFGHLVSITSIASLVGNRHVPAYHASKAFQSSYMESLWMKARKTKKAKITVTNILPGYVDTDIITDQRFGWHHWIKRSNRL